MSLTVLHIRLAELVDAALRFCETTHLPADRSPELADLEPLFDHTAKLATAVAEFLDALDVTLGNEGAGPGERRPLDVVRAYLFAVEPPPTESGFHPGVPRRVTALGKLPAIYGFLISHDNRLKAPASPVWLLAIDLWRAMTYGTSAANGGLLARLDRISDIAGVRDRPRETSNRVAVSSTVDGVVLEVGGPRIRQSYPWDRRDIEMLHRIAARATAALIPPTGIERVRLLNPTASTWRVESVAPDGSGRVRGPTAALPFAATDTPVALAPGEWVDVRLHSLGDHKLGVLGLAPTVGRLSRAESTGLMQGADACAHFESTLSRIPMLTATLVAAGTRGDDLIILARDSDDNEYGLRGRDHTLQGAMIFNGAIAWRIRAERIIGAYDATPPERAYFERAVGRPIGSSPLIVIAHPWRGAASLSFVAAAGVRYVPPPPFPVARVIVELTRLDKQLRIEHVEAVSQGPRVELWATDRKGGRHPLATEPGANREQLEILARGLDAIVANEEDDDEVKVYDSELDRRL